MEYRLRLVGERSYQANVRRCRSGQPATIAHEIGNPHDALALRVDVGGATVGYVPKASWVRDAVHDQGKTITARVDEVHEQNGSCGIVLIVELGPKGDVPSVAYSGRSKARASGGGQRRKAAAGGGGAILAMLLKSLFKSGRRRR